MIGVMTKNLSNHILKKRTETDFFFFKAAAAVFKWFLILQFAYYCDYDHILAIKH